MFRISIDMARHGLSPFLLTVLGIAVAFLLAAAMCGGLMGRCHATSTLTPHADLWVVAPRTPAFFAMAARMITAIRGQSPVGPRVAMHLDA
jgi:hypothetical protein